MINLGDITKISGYNAPIVDVVIGGSPCQDLSVAGKRAGLAGERSGLYMEQIRIIKEMRERDKAAGRTDRFVRPRYTSWGEFRRLLEYKAQWYGKVVSTVDRFYPSSQLCSSCGAQWPGTKDLSVREWTCPVCGVVHDRDVNAAKNILSEGLRVLA